MEAARIDGASSLRIFTQIVLPLSKPVIAVNVLNTFMAVYNDYIMPQLLLPSEEKWTIMLRVFIAQNGNNATMNKYLCDAYRNYNSGTSGLPLCTKECY
jgi:ABC-type maltose transport system permease subunit